MNEALLSFLFDTLYVVIFFIVMTAAAYGVGLVVKLCEAGGLDAPVIWILRGLEIGLVAIDAAGVLIVAAVLMQRFVRLAIDADKPRI